MKLFASKQHVVYRIVNSCGLVEFHASWLLRPTHDGVDRNTFFCQKRVMAQLQALKAIPQAELERAIVQERNDDVQQLVADLTDLQEIAHDLTPMLHEQGETLEDVDMQVAQALGLTQAAVADIQEAEVQVVRVRKRKWFLKGLLAFGGITLGGLALALVSPVAGLVTAGVGVTGGVILAVKKRWH